MDLLLRELDTTQSSSSAGIDVLLHGIQCWVTERVAPDVLSADEEMINKLLTAITTQLEVVEAYAAADTKSNLMSIILHTELERIKFVLRSYLRTRLMKLDLHPSYYSGEPNAELKLMHLERQYLDKHENILARHLHSLFLREFPETGHMRSLIDRAAAGIDMVTGPDLDRAVFCRAKVSIPEPIATSTGEVEIQQGDTMLLKYKLVRQFVLEVSLIGAY